jgi:outer membrane protein OmpA-like peptidoglycan-associated protein
MPRAGLQSTASALALALVTLGCSAAALVPQRVQRVELRIEHVQGTGGYSCAPRELALALAHLEFARTEIDQGNPRRALEHLDESDLQAQAAEHLTSPRRCSSASIAAAGDGSQLGPDSDGDGISDALDQCVSEPEDLDGNLDTDGCPDLDDDRDGIPDTLDRCPAQPEDKDGVADEDGCPDADSDRDRDGIADDVDRCPDLVGVSSTQGCPRLQYRGAEITPHSVRLQDPISFQGETAAIDAASYALLDTLAELLSDHPRITLEVQGHTDSRGEPAQNLRLSQARAEAVRDELVRRGVEVQRLTPKGYGETRPIESNRTSQGRAINRRMELVRTDGGP